MKTNTKPSPSKNQPNNLWRARNRAGLERKQVAFLLSKKLTDEISRYERGLCLPSLQTALKLEIIYRLPVHLLFEGLFEELRTEINERRRKHQFLLPGEAWFPKPVEQLRQEEFCFYADLLKQHIPSNLEMEIVNRHIIALNNTLINFKQDRNPFADEPLNKNKDEL